MVGIATLAALTVGLALFGWSLRPASGGYPVLANTMKVELGSSVPGGIHPEMTESLTRVAGGGTLLIRGDLAAPASVRWSVDFFQLDTGWRLCTPRTVTFTGGGAASELLLDRQHVVLNPRNFGSTNPAFVMPDEVKGSGPFYLELCWSVGGPVQANGAYLSARFIAVDDVQASVGLARQLNLGAGTTADYSIQSVVQPSSDYGGGWQWSERPLARTALAVSAVNTSETQHDSYQAFLSGIVFGVAGGALVALIQELVAPFRSRRELRPPEPGG
ncbi:MAG TPA: hypothetical protein VGF87_10880 [Acidimicrobiales bacterium]